MWYICIHAYDTHPNTALCTTTLALSPDVICISISEKIKSNFIMSSAGRLTVWEHRKSIGNSPTANVHLGAWIIMKVMSQLLGHSNDGLSRHRIQGMQAEWAEFVSELNITSFFLSYALRANHISGVALGEDWDFLRRDDAVWWGFNNLGKSILPFCWVYNIMNIWNAGRARQSWLISLPQKHT